MSTTPGPLLFECHDRKDPVAALVKDLKAEEVAAWLVRYHGLKPESADVVASNLREQFRWHRLQGRLDRSNFAAAIAELLLMRRTPLTLKTPEEKPAEEEKP